MADQARAEYIMHVHQSIAIAPASECGKTAWTKAHRDMKHVAVVLHASYQDAVQTGRSAHELTGHEMHLCATQV